MQEVCIISGNQSLLEPHLLGVPGLHVVHAGAVPLLALQRLPSQEARVRLQLGQRGRAGGCPICRHIVHCPPACRPWRMKAGPMMLAKRGAHGVGPCVVKIVKSYLNHKDRQYHEWSPQGLAEGCPLLVVYQLRIYDLTSVHLTHPGQRYMQPVLRLWMFD